MDSTLALIVLGAAGLVVLLTQVPIECTLFLYGLSLGFPDILPLGTMSQAINVRLDDFLVGVLLLHVVTNGSTTAWTRSQRAIAMSMALFASICVVSLALTLWSDLKPELYFVYRFVGTAVMFFTLLRSVESPRAMKWLGTGMLIAGLALVVQILPRIASFSPTSSTYYEYKHAASFKTWNPNTFGQIATVLSYLAGLRAFGVTRAASSPRWVMTGVAAFFAISPAMVFSRTATVSLFASWCLFFLVSRRWKQALCMCVIAVTALLWFASSERQYVAEATSIDVTTGAGFSGRFDLWAVARGLLEAHPILGNGFGLETRLFAEKFGGGMSHNAVLSILVELGAVGLLGMVAVLIAYWAGLRRLMNCAGRRDGPALLMCLLVAECIQSCFGSALYWEKPCIMGIALIGVYLGIFEREEIRCSHVADIRIERY